MMELNVAGIVGESIVDGPGIRLTVFCQGCPHHCPGCQNPETWEFAERTRMSPEQILEMVKRNPLIRGVTLSGGEPFSQPEEHAQLAQLLHQNGYEVAGGNTSAAPTAGEYRRSGGRTLPSGEKDTGASFPRQQQSKNFECARKP